MTRTATTYVDYQQRASGFEVGDRVTPYFDGAGEDYAGVVTAVWPAIGMVDVEFPHGSKRYPAEDLQVLEKAEQREYIMPQSPSVPGGVGSVPVSGGPRTRQAAREVAALYWAQRDRKYRPCKSELDRGKYTCPRCRTDEGGRIHLIRVPYKRIEGVSERLLSCPSCRFVIKEDDILTPNGDCDQPEGLEVEVEVKMAGRKPSKNPFHKSKVKVVFSDARGYGYTAEIDERGASEYLEEYGRASGFPVSSDVLFQEPYELESFLSPKQLEELESGYSVTVRMDPWEALHMWGYDAHTMAEGYDPFDDGRRASENSELRRRVIRLAYENPELRDDLLPMIKEATSKWKPKLSDKTVKEEISRYYAPRQQTYDPTMMGNSGAKDLAAPIIDSLTFNAAADFYFSDWNRKQADDLHSKIMGLPTEDPRLGNFASNMKRRVFSAHAGSSMPWRYWGKQRESEISEMLDGLAAVSKEFGVDMSEIRSWVTSYLEQVREARTGFESQVVKTVHKVLKKVGLDDPSKYAGPPKKLAARDKKASIGSGKNGYIAFYKRKKVEVYADSKLEARDLAAEHFRARRPYDVEVVLAEKGGKQVTHMPLFASKKTASRSGHDILNVLIPDFKKAWPSVRKMDRQSGDLMRETYLTLAKSLDLSTGEQHALSRLQQIAENYKRWDPALIRNNAFKAADSAGLSLPSGMFASEKKSHKR